jgi:hypothetical protein
MVSGTRMALIWVPRLPAYPEARKPANEEREPGDLKRFSKVDNGNSLQLRGKKAMFDAFNLRDCTGANEVIGSSNSMPPGCDPVFVRLVDDALRFGWMRMI